jgi:transposase
MAHDASELIPLSEAATILGISRNTATWLVRNGTLEGLRLPGGGSRPRRLYVKRGQVEALRGGAWRRIKPRRTKENNGS